MSSRWIKWFSEEDSTESDEELASSLARARECLQVADMPWFKDFIDKLGEDSLKPGTIGDHAAMIAAVARSNAFKEIRGRILDNIARARSFIASIREV